jgi:hypothetical protein
MLTEMFPVRFCIALTVAALCLFSPGALSAGDQDIPKAGKVAGPTAPRPSIITRLHCASFGSGSDQPAPGPTSFHRISRTN